MPRAQRRVRRPQGAPDRDQQATHRAALHHGAVYRPHRVQSSQDRVAQPAAAPERPAPSTANDQPSPSGATTDELWSSLDPGWSTSTPPPATDAGAPVPDHRPEPGPREADARAAEQSPASEPEDRRLYTHLSVDPGDHMVTEDGTSLWAPREPDEQPRRNGHQPPRNGHSSRDHGHPAVALDFVRDDNGQAMIGTLAALRHVDDVEAGTFAVRFACDFLSWDEDDQQRRSHVLRDYLAGGHSSTLGWNGLGRQRADAPTYGRMERRSATTVIVEVWVRITPYTRAGPDAPEPDTAHQRADDLGMPLSSAPAPHATGWVAGAAYWLSMAVPVTRDHRDPGGRLVVNPSLIPTATP